MVRRRVSRPRMSHDAESFMRAAEWPNNGSARLMCTVCTVADGHDYRAHYNDATGKYDGPLRPTFNERMVARLRAEGGRQDPRSGRWMFT